MFKLALVRVGRIFRTRVLRWQASHLDQLDEAIWAATVQLAKIKCRAHILTVVRGEKYPATLSDEYIVLWEQRIRLQFLLISAGGTRDHLLAHTNSILIKTGIVVDELERCMEQIEHRIDAQRKLACLHAGSTNQECSYDVRE